MCVHIFIGLACNIQVLTLGISDSSSGLILESILGNLKLGQDVIAPEKCGQSLRRNNFYLEDLVYANNHF